MEQEHGRNLEGFAVPEVQLVDKAGSRFTRSWEGHMGVGIRFHSNGTFEYWFYSNVVVDSTPKYPSAGNALGWRSGAICRHLQILQTRIGWQWQRSNSSGKGILRDIRITL